MIAFIILYALVALDAVVTFCNMYWYKKYTKFLREKGGSYNV